MLLLPEEHFEVIRELCRLLPPDEVNWALTGSAGHRLQGVDIPVHDIDMQTDEVGAHTVARVLDAHMVQPLAVRESQLMWSLFGIFHVSDITVEVMGAVRKRHDAEESWGPATDPAEHRYLVDYQGIAVPGHYTIDVGKARRSGLTNRPIGQTISDILRWADENRTSAVAPGSPILTREREAALLDQWRSWAPARSR